MKSIFLKKILVMSAILGIQGFFLYAFYINEGLIFNFKTSYLTKVYLPSYIQSLNNLKLKTGNYLVSVASVFNFNTVYSENIFSGDSQYAKSIPVLLYHGIIENADGSNILLEDFKDQMFALKKAGWETITLDDFYAFMRDKKELPDKSFLLTFDDGRKDSYYPVDPILNALDYNAVIFVITKYSLEDKSGNFYLSKKELKQMAKSGRWEIEAHTREGHDIYKISQDGKQGHYYSNKLWLDDKNRLETEEEFVNRIKSDFISAKSDIEQGLGVEVISFAFPFGDFGQDSVNFPEAEPIISDLAKSIYSTAFYQVWPGKDFSFNYPKENQFLIKRIEVRSYWSSDNLLKVLDTAKAKSLPYFDNFGDYNGWVKKWGRILFDDNGLKIMSLEDSTGAVTILVGSYDWSNYLFNSKIYFNKGETFSILGRFLNDDNFVACVFSNKSIKIEQVLNGNKKIIAEQQGDFQLIGGVYNAGIALKGGAVNCYLDNYLDNEITITSLGSYNLDPLLDFGGIGFKIWDPQFNNSEMIIKEVSIKEIK